MERRERRLLRCDSWSGPVLWVSKWEGHTERAEGPDPCSLCSDSWTHCQAFCFGPSYYTIQSGQSSHVSHYPASKTSCTILHSLLSTDEAVQKLKDGRTEELEQAGCRVTPWSRSSPLIINEWSEKGSYCRYSKHLRYQADTGSRISWQKQDTLAWPWAHVLSFLVIIL